MEGQDVFSNNTSGSSDQLEGISLAEHYRWKNIELARQGKFGHLKSSMGNIKNCYTFFAGHLDDCYTSIFISGAKGTGKKELISEFTRIEQVYRKLNNAPHVTLKTYDSELPELLFQKDKSETFNIYLRNIEFLRLDQQERLLNFLLERKNGIPYNSYTNRLILSSESSLKLLSHQNIFSKKLFNIIEENVVNLPLLNERLPDLLELFYSNLLAHTNMKQYPPAWLLNNIYMYSWPENIDSMVRMISYLVDQFGKDVNQWDEETITPLLKQFITVENKTLINNKERQSIESTLKIFEGDKEKTASYLKIKRNMLIEKMLMYNIR